MIGDARDGGNCGVGPMKNTRKRNFQILAARLKKWFSAREKEGRIWRAFEKLSARQREVFVLHHVDGWSTEEVADMLGITTGSVKRYLFRAARHLRRILGDR